MQLYQKCRLKKGTHIGRKLIFHGDFEKKMRMTFSEYGTSLERYGIILT